MPRESGPLSCVRSVIQRPRVSFVSNPIPGLNEVYPVQGELPRPLASLARRALADRAQNDFFAIEPVRLLHRNRNLRMIPSALQVVSSEGNTDRTRQNTRTFPLSSWSISYNRLRVFLRRANPVPAFGPSVPSFPINLR